MSKVQGRGQSTSRPSSPKLLIAIPTLTILAGVLVHILVFYLAPKNGPEPDNSEKMDISRLAAEIQMSDAWPAFLRARSGPDVKSATQTLLIIIVFFRDMLSTQFARGLLWLLAVASMPLMLHFLLESTKAGRHPLLSPLNIFIMASIGQLVCLGCAVNLISVPSHAYVRYAQIVRANDALNASKKDRDQAISQSTLNRGAVHPLPSAGYWKTNVASFLAALAIVTTALTIHVSPTKYSQEWIASNLVFQFYPVFFLPLLLPGLSAAAAAELAPVPKSGTIVTPRLHSARLYRNTSLIAVPLWWLVLYLTATPLCDKVRHLSNVINDIGSLKAIQFIQQEGIRSAINVAFPLSNGEWLLIWDCIGALIALFSVAWIDLVADDWAYRLFSSKVSGYKRPHEERHLLEDAIVGLPSTLVLGPGFTGAQYFQRREIMAEKARLSGE
ncbi:unnamed protein product [Tilletia controversa]|uniref:Uncharacterized protein n=4 Tax=Tilletia TaxID=13289 RepID=A0A8X7MUT2_9BASI|nr:hypothetical protein CF335_g6392 [Tilletia laevis]KAE8194660.1 hypothetical protein CF328_g4674 [Tilletia controversa]CAD6886471.1 unnamed protein product [Tilletia caries]KAE8191065.1 hypothetical protein CF336_g5031 [Tilletia laevis]KAE8249120.1 hypothetical protein A4X06_0g3374 [Tilletia controversa]